MDVEAERFCPTCGRRNVLQHSPEWLLTQYTGVFANILAYLIECRRNREMVSKRDLCFAAYVDRFKGPPVHANTMVEAFLTKERPSLHHFGWDIVGPQITGHGYMLVPLESEY